MTRRNTGGFISAKEQATDSNSANGIFTLSEAAALTTGGNFPTGGFSPTNSVRFRASAGAHFNTAVIPAVGSTTTYSWFGWIKLGQLGTTRRIFTCGTNPGGVAFYLSSSDTLNLSLSIQAAEALNTTQVLRDPSAWYHVGFSVDTTQVIASNRVMFFINGAQVTAFTANYPTQNTVTQVNGGVYNHFVGRESFAASNYFDGYMSEVYFIDGQALSASSFGQTDPATGVWIPKKYTGTFGVNGFYLPFNRTDVTFNMDYLVAAGGGGGGASTASGTGGGGGAGGLTIGTSTAISTGTYKLTVGAGGAAASNGSRSVFYTAAIGGGTGGSFNTTPGQAGGSGGGGAGGGGITTNANAGAGTAGQGNAGGAGSTSNAPAGGGGGAGAAGTAGTISNSGSGGNGSVSTIITTTQATAAAVGQVVSTSVYFAGGSAGGGAGAAAGTAGLGGGSLTNGNGTPNTGGSGGGSSPGNPGGLGGSGVVIIKIPDTRTATFSSGVTFSGGTASGGFKTYIVTATSTTSETVTLV